MSRLFSSTHCSRCSASDTADSPFDFADRPHIQHLLTATKLLAQEPTLFVPPSSTAAVASALKSGSAASANKALKTPRKHVKAAPSPLSLASVMVHDLLFAKRGLTLPKEHKVRKKLEKYQPA